MKKRIVSIMILICFMISFKTIIVSSTDNTNEDTELLGTSAAILIELVSSAENIKFGDEVILTATVTIEDDEPDPTLPEGTVTFYGNDDIELGLVSEPVENNEYSLTLDDLSIETHTIYAVYSDGDIQSDNIQVIVGKLDSSIVLETSAAIVKKGDPITFTATIEGAEDGEEVEFFSDSASIGKSVVEDEVAVLVINTLSAKEHSIKAEFSGNEMYNESESNTIIQKVLSDDNKLTKLYASNHGNITLYTNQTTYSLSYINSVESIRLTPTVALNSGAAIKVNGWDVESGKTTKDIYIRAGETTKIEIIVTAENGVERKYIINAFRAKATTTNSSTSNTGRSVRYRFAAGTQQIVYGDVANHWASNTINALTAEGVFTGEKIGSISYFHPDRNMTRTEFAVIIARVMNLDLDLTKFLDLPFEDRWQIPEWGLVEVRSVYFNGWIDGDGYNFRPESSISRAEAMTILSRITGHYGSQTHFNDSADIPSWAQGAVSGLVNAGVVNGYSDNTIRPNDTITRAEVASIIYKAFK